MTNTDLRPCPKCGEKAEQDEDAIYCPTCDCHLILDVYHDFEAAKSAWNYRPLEDALISRAEKAEADCKRYAEINELDSAEWLKEKARAERAEAEVARLNRMVERLKNSVHGFVESGEKVADLYRKFKQYSREDWLAEISATMLIWDALVTDWQSANGHQARKVSENEGSEG